MRALGPGAFRELDDTDDAEHEGDNWRLSLRRALAVKRWLVRHHHIPVRRIRCSATAARISPCPTRRGRAGRATGGWWSVGSDR